MAKRYRSHRIERIHRVFMASAQRDAISRRETGHIEPTEGVHRMLTMAITFGVLLVMALSGTIAARAPESLVTVQRADSRPRVPTSVF